MQFRIYMYLYTRVPEMYITLIRTLKPKSILYLPVPPSRSAYHSPSLLDSKPYHTSSYKPNKMPSSKGEPTDPELREKVKEEVKAEEKGKVSIYLPRYPSICLSIRLSINKQNPTLNRTIILHPPFQHAYLPARLPINLLTSSSSST